MSWRDCSALERTTRASRIDPEHSRRKSALVSPATPWMETLETCINFIIVDESVAITGSFNYIGRLAVGRSGGRAP